MEWLQETDERILLWIQEHMREDVFDDFWRTVTFLGDKGWFLILLGGTLLLFRKTRLAGAGALLSMGLGAAVTNLVLKRLVARPRPYDRVEGLLPLVERLTDGSFPSGHTCAAFASAYVYWKLLPRKYGWTALALAALMGLSRLYLGMHYATDVAGGLLVGWLSGLAVCRALKRWENRK